jgi:hypothetical protein
LGIRSAGNAYERRWTGLMPNENDPSTRFLALEEFINFRNASKDGFRVPMNVDASCGKRWPEIGPDEGIADTEASIDKQYFAGLDIGFEKDTTVMAEGHLEDGKLVIDRYIQPKPELGDAVRVPANQGL